MPLASARITLPAVTPSETKTVMPLIDAALRRQIRECADAFLIRQHATTILQISGVVMINSLMSVRS